ncbi:hypothetical protein [Pelagicoccus mobilis]|uniref:Uncharacterized protein n=1 Tax=Pelagicoccus mobilis TaxID=415221 RepID=A0A934RYF9_9BACT|nr:hypothetical protein [Pelagicoccus mobilis]MBK1877156.1 hypothetical protein [Pelagicoccus mobilis]
MTQKRSKVSALIQGALCPERRQTRSLLRKASRGNVHAFMQAVTPYMSLVSEYLYLAGFTEQKARLLELTRVLCDCWRYLPYTRRVSDFERFLQVRLERSQEQAVPSFDGVHKVLNGLSHDGRFLLVARVFHDWSHKALKLSLRTRTSEIRETLLNLRCALCGVETDKLSYVELAQVSRVNEMLEGTHSDKICRKIEKEVGNQYHALQFKADWLVYRCELADLQTEMTLNGEQIAELSDATIKQIKQQPMEKPRLYDSLINQISFNRLPLL